MPLTSESFWPWRLRPRVTATDDVAVPAQDLYAALIRDRISPALRAEGLIGSGGRYSLKSNTHWALVSFEKSAYSDRREIQFTINLCVVRKDECNALRVEHPYYPEKPSGSTIYGCVMPTRIGSLVGDGSDKWWRVYHGQDVASVAANVLMNVRDAGLPWLHDQVVNSS